MVLKNSIVILMVLAFCSAASGAEKKRIAVLPFNTKNVSQVTGEIVRDIIEVELISSRRFTVIEREQMGAILKEQNIKPGACDETACAYQYGKALSIDYMVIGKVMKLDNYLVSLRLIDIKNRVVLSADKLKSESVRGLEKAAEELAEIFLDQLSSDNPRPRDLVIRQNRPGSIVMSLLFNYTQIRSIGIPIFEFPDSYGEPIRFVGRDKKHYGVGGGLSVAVALFPYLSLRGDISYIYFIRDRTVHLYNNFSEAAFYYTAYTEVTHKINPPVISGDFLVQFNYVFGPVMPFAALGVGYSRYFFKSEFIDVSDLYSELIIKSQVTNDSDDYNIRLKTRSNLFSLVGDIGVTVFFDNAIGLTLSCGLRYAPKQNIYKKISLVKTNAGIAASDPILDIYKDLDKKLGVSEGKAQVEYNLKFGFTFRML